MADLKKLAMGRKAFAQVKDGAAKNGKSADKPEKPAKSLEESSAEEIGEVEAAFRGRIEKEDKRRKAATDSEFWFAVYFQSREEKDVFLRKYGLDKIGDKYLPGSQVRRILEMRMGVNRDAHKR
jgi:hypothetical protein